MQYMLVQWDAHAASTTKKWYYTTLLWKGKCSIAVACVCFRLLLVLGHVSFMLAANEELQSTYLVLLLKLRLHFNLKAQ